MGEMIASILAAALSKDEEWKTNYYKDYLLGIIDYDMLKFELQLQEILKR